MDGDGSKARRGMRTPPEDILRRRVKEELRRRHRALRKAMPLEARQRRATQAAQQALTWLAEEGLLTDGGVLASFSPIHYELDPAPLEDALATRGVRFAYPVVDMEAQRLVMRIANRESLVPGAFGIPEPKSDAPEAKRIDVVLVPALAIDPRGHRVGYGKGFYDQLLPTLEGARRLAYVYDFQLVPETPNETQDVPVHTIVSDLRTMRCEGS